MGCRKNSPGKPCCDDCSILGCPSVALPDGLKDITFETSAYNPLSETTTGTFSRNFSVGTCCARMDLPMSASYLSPVYNGVEFFSDYGKFPITQCCGTTGSVIGFYEAKVQLAASFALQFRLRLCNIRVDVCFTGTPSCGLSVTTTAIFGRKFNGESTQESQSKRRTKRDAYTPCGSYVELPASDTTVFRRECDDPSNQPVAVSPYPTDFVDQPEPPEVAEPPSFDCSYGNSFDGQFYPIGAYIEYFSIRRTAFLAGATSIPCSPISFTPTGQTLVSAPDPFVVSRRSYAAFSQTTLSNNACGQSRCEFLNFGAGEFFGQCQFITFGDGCVYDYERILNQPRNLAIGTRFFDPMGDDWSLTIC